MIVIWCRRLYLETRKLLVNSHITFTVAYDTRNCAMAILQLHYRILVPIFIIHQKGPLKCEGSITHLLQPSPSRILVRNIICKLMCFRKVVRFSCLLLWYKFFTIRVNRNNNVKVFVTLRVDAYWSDLVGYSDA